MYVPHHDLGQEFPEFKQQIHHLKQTDHRFQRLVRDYEEIDKKICRVEDGLERMNALDLEDLKKHRLHLKDRLFGCLQKPG
jgi:uncharacterized protein